MQWALGLAVLFLPLLGLGMMFLRRRLPILFFYTAMCLLALGYLSATGAIEDIGVWAQSVGTQFLTALEGP